MTTQNIINLSMKALPFLIYCAQQRKTPTYKDVAEQCGCHHRTMTHILAYLRDEICIAEGLPNLTALVVNKFTRLPGTSFLPEGTAHLTSDEYLIKFEIFRDQAFAYQGWDDLLKRFSLTPWHQAKMA